MTCFNATVSMRATVIWAGQVLLVSSRTWGLGCDILELNVSSCLQAVNAIQVKFTIEAIPIGPLPVLQV